MIRAFLFRSSPVLAVLAILALAGCGGGEPSAKTREAPRVTVAHPLVRSLVDEDDYNGWLQAFKAIEVRARVRGHITKVHFKDGDIVTQGQPLFDIDPAPFEAELKQTEAEIRALAAQELAAKRSAERYEFLVKTNAASQQETDKARAEADSFEAQIAAKKAEADRRRLDLKYSKITADLAGKISKANLVEGDLVNAGGSDPVLTTIVSIDPIYVDFNVDERALQRYQASAFGERADKTSLRQQKAPFSFALDTEEGFPHQGELVFADNKFNPGTGTILVRGVAANKDGRLVPGSRVR